MRISEESDGSLLVVADFGEPKEWILQIGHYLADGSGLVVTVDWMECRLSLTPNSPVG